MGQPEQSCISLAVLVLVLRAFRSAFWNDPLSSSVRAGWGGRTEGRSLEQMPLQLLREGTMRTWTRGGGKREEYGALCVVGFALGNMEGWQGLVERAKSSPRPHTGLINRRFMIPPRGQILF